jgi:c-di-GMP-binding flagellar brake protein YcgR
MSSAPQKAHTAAPNRRQRRYPRYRCEFPVEVSLFHDEGRQLLTAHCRDLSEAGIGVLVAAELTPGEVASMQFNLPGLPQAWDMRAVLRHRRGYHYGFEFLSLSRQQAQTLRDYLPSLPRADSED